MYPVIILGRPGCVLRGPVLIKEMWKLFFFMRHCVKRIEDSLRRESTSVLVFHCQSSR